MMKQKILLLFVLSLLATLILVLPSVSALCALDFVSYHGSCAEDGDLRVVSAEGEVLVEQFYTVNRACYHGRYLVAVPGGSGDDCRIRTGDQIQFQVGGVPMGTLSWSAAEKAVALDLVRTSFKEVRSDIFSQGLLYFVLTVMALLVVIVSILEFYRRRR